MITKKIITQPNYLYNSTIFTKFINKFSKHGKQKKIFKLIYKAFFVLKQQHKLNPMSILLTSLMILKPEIHYLPYYRKHQARLKRRKKSRYVPVPVSNHRSNILALTWFVLIILSQKKLRRRHTTSNKEFISRRKMSALSKVKGFHDRYQISLKEQTLDQLICQKFIELHKTNYHQLQQFKTNIYIRLIKNRGILHYRWQ